MKKPTSIFCICISIAFMSILVPNELFSQTNFDPHYSTQYPDNGRYEIVSSGIKRAFTFKLDRYSGKVFQIVLTSTNENIWSALDVIGHPENNGKMTTYESPSYQLFLSGAMARDAFLLDIKKGFTWKLVQDSITEELFFHPIVSEVFYDKNIELLIKEDESQKNIPQSNSK